MGAWDDAQAWMKENPAGTAGLALAALLVVLILLVRRVRTTAVRLAATVYLWVAFWGSHTLVLIIQCLLMVTVGWMLPAKRRDQLLGHCQQISIFILINLNPFWYISVVRKPKSIPKGAIIVSNHLSYVDSWIVASSVFPVAPKFVAMGSLFRMPVFGQVMKLAGHINVEFFRKEDGRWGVENSEEIMERAKAKLDWGRRLVVFPEGTLSKKGDLLPFKDGFFRLSFDQKRPIVPVACWGNHKMFPPGNQFNLASFAIVKVAVGDAVDPSQFDSVDALRDHVHDLVRKLRDGLPNFDLYDPATLDQASTKIAPEGSALVASPSVLGTSEPGDLEAARVSFDGAPEL